jgi:hypothetical protein
VPKAILPAPSIGRASNIRDTVWKRLRKHIPKALSPDAEARLRHEVSEACSWQKKQSDRFKEGLALAQVMKRPSKNQDGPMVGLRNSLQKAAQAWEKIKRPPLGEPRQRLEERVVAETAAELKRVDPGIGLRLDETPWPVENTMLATKFLRHLPFKDRRFEDLKSMWQSANGLLKAVQELVKTRRVDDPYEEFVCKIATCWEKVDLEVTWKTDVYLGEKPTEFQMFMEILEDGVLGVDGKGGLLKDSLQKGRRKSLQEGRPAYCAMIAKVLRERTTGKTPATIP